MYRILIAKPGLPKDAYIFHKKQVTVINQDDNTETTSTEIFETDDIAILEAEYIDLLKKYTSEQVLPIDNLTVAFDVVITDETT